MLSRKRIRLVLAGGLLALLGSVTGLARNAPLSTAELMVVLARDYALNLRGQQTAADVQQVRALLKAAVRLDPTLADAQAWLYELALLDGDQAEADRVLSDLLKADPTNETAFGRWLEAGLRAQQTTEKRAEWLEAVAVTRRPPGQLALVHVARAQLALETLDTAEARRQITRALELEPACVEAAGVARDMLGPEAGPQERLRAALRVLQVSPLSVAAAWQAGAILDDYGLAELATSFLDQAVTAQRKTDPQAPLPGGLLLACARNQLARGNLSAAVDRTRDSIAADPATAAQAGMLLYYLMSKQAPGSETVVRDQLAQRFATIRDPADWPINEVAQAAWFYTLLVPQPDRALMLAKAAAARAPADDFVQRVLGWALLRNGQTDEARQTLAPIAARDGFAAYLLAKSLWDGGDEAAARRVVEGLDPKPMVGAARDMLDSLPFATTARPTTSTQSTQPATAPAASQPRGGVAAALQLDLAEFDARVFDFYRDPTRYLEVRVALDNRSLALGEPWAATFTLTNRGPFAITLGPDGMVNPVLILSFAVEGNRKRDLPGLMTVNVDELRVLHPGQAAQVRRMLDVGPLRRVAFDAPQQLQRITLTAVLDGVRGEDGRWRPGPGGQESKPVYFNRLPLGTGPEALNTLFAAAGRTTVEERGPALEIMAALLGERQRATLKKLEYEPAPVPADRFQAALLSGLGDESWEVRVRALNALQAMGLDRSLIQAAEGCLDHPQWLVRLLAVRLLARQGPAFSERAASVARNDIDELVRLVADSYVKKAAEAASAPQETQPAGP